MISFDINSRNTKALKKFFDDSLAREDISKNEHKMAMAAFDLGKELNFSFELGLSTQTVCHMPFPR